MYCEILYSFLYLLPGPRPFCGRLYRGRVGGAGERDILCVEAGSDAGVVIPAVAAG